MYSSETSVFRRAIWHHIPEDSILYCYCHENIKKISFLHSSRNIPRTFYSKKWWCPSATMFAKFILMWLLLMGISQAQGLREMTSCHLWLARLHQDYCSASSSWHTEEDNRLSLVMCRESVCRTMEPTWLMLSLKHSYHMACSSTHFTTCTFSKIMA
jgi:hypothetical protein